MFPEKGRKLLALKSEGDIKIRQEHLEEPLKIYEQKKAQMENGEINYNRDDLEKFLYSNNLMVESKSPEKKPLSIYLIEPKEKEEKKIQYQQQSHLVMNDFSFCNNNNDINEPNDGLGFEFFGEYMKGEEGGEGGENNEKAFRKDSFNSMYSLNSENNRLF